MHDRETNFSHDSDEPQPLHHQAANRQEME